MRQIQSVGGRLNKLERFPQAQPFPTRLESIRSVALQGLDSQDLGGSKEDKFDHPTQKPVELMRRPILNHTKAGELVYEPFLGSGTTLAAAEGTERVCYGVELDPKYCDVIVERWQKLTGGKATLEGDGRTFDDIGLDRSRMAA